jgi:hypothetical protein
MEGGTAPMAMAGSSHGGRIHGRTCVHPFTGGSGGCGGDGPGGHGPPTRVRRRDGHIHMVHMRAHACIPPLHVHAQAGRSTTRAWCGRPSRAPPGGTWRCRSAPLCWPAVPRATPRWVAHPTRGGWCPCHVGPPCHQRRATNAGHALSCVGVLRVGRAPTQLPSLAPPWACAFVAGACPPPASGHRAPLRFRNLGPWHLGRRCCLLGLGSRQPWWPGILAWTPGRHFRPTIFALPPTCTSRPGAAALC